jgi:hypothetical protein
VWIQLLPLKDPLVFPLAALLGGTGSSFKQQYTEDWS